MYPPSSRLGATGRPGRPRSAAVDLVSESCLLAPYSPPSFTAGLRRDSRRDCAPRGGRNAWWLADCRYQDVREVVRLAVLDAQRRRGGRVWRLPRRPTLPLPARGGVPRREGFSLDKLAALRAIPLQLDGPNEIGAANNAPINEDLARPLTL